MLTEIDELDKILEEDLRLWKNESVGINVRRSKTKIRNTEKVSKKSKA